MGWQAQENQQSLAPFVAFFIKTSALEAVFYAYADTSPERT
jgi:hypothetical protein